MSCPPRGRSRDGFDTFEVGSTYIVEYATCAVKSSDDASLDGTEIATGVQPYPVTANEVTLGLASALTTGEGYVDQSLAWKK